MIVLRLWPNNYFDICSLMNKKPIFNLNDESDDDDDMNDSINILLSSENVKINYYQLLKWSKLVRDQYPKDEINRLSKDIQIFSQKYDIKDKSIKSFFSIFIQ